MANLKLKKQYLITNINQHTALNIFLLHIKKIIKLRLLDHFSFVEINFIFEKLINAKMKDSTVTKTMKKFSAPHLFKIEKQLVLQTNELWARYALLRDFVIANIERDSIVDENKVKKFIKNIKKITTNDDLINLFGGETR